MPEVGLLLATDLAVLDHFDGSVLLIANAIVDPHRTSDNDALRAAHADAVDRLDAMAERLAQPVVDSLAVFESGQCRSTNQIRRRASTTRRLKLLASTFTQAMRFRSSCRSDSGTQTTASALDIYRVLRVSNLSPTCT